MNARSEATAMMPYQSYQLWQTERPKSAREQRAADRRLGELAAALARRDRGGRRSRAGRPAIVPRPRPAASLAGVCNDGGLQH
jgi:hypothetical protein